MRVTLRPRNLASRRFVLRLITVLSRVCRRLLALGRYPNLDVLPSPDYGLETVVTMGAHTQRGHGRPILENKTAISRA
jgi:hypothetical protein